MDTSKAGYVGFIRGWETTYEGFQGFREYGEYYFYMHCPRTKKAYPAIIRDYDNERIVRFNRGEIPEYVALTLISYYEEKTGIADQQRRRAETRLLQDKAGTAGWWLTSVLVRGLFG